MDEDALAPMADALSATLAVFILLICFFVMAQVDAVSKQIEVERIGDREVMMDSLNLSFDLMSEENNQFIFFNSFNPELNQDVIERRVKAITASCNGCEIEIVSNYPSSHASVERATRRATVNALKMASILEGLGLEYTVRPITEYNYYFIELKKYN